jgi:hypothetical protein
MDGVGARRIASSVGRNETIPGAGGLSGRWIGRPDLGFGRTLGRHRARRLQRQASSQVWSQNRIADLALDILYISIFEYTKQLMPVKSPPPVSGGMGSDALESAE